MNTKDFYVKLIDDMRASFESEYSKETIDEWKNGFEYRWYDEHGSKYNSLLSKYVRDNLYQYVINATKNSSIEDKQEIFEFLYLSGYKNLLIKNNKILFIDLLDVPTLEVILEKRDYAFFTRIIVESKNSDKLLERIKNNFLYEMRCSDLSLYELRYLKSLGVEDSKLRDVFFENLCIHDSYGRNIYDYLAHDCGYLNEYNMKSLLKHFCINELLYNYMGFYVNKAEEFESVIEDNIREGRTKIENDKCKEYLSTLSTLTDENKERKLLPFYVKLPTKDKVLLKKYGKN